MRVVSLVIRDTIRSEDKQVAKYRVVQKGSLVTVKSRLSRKDIVNERELDYLMQNYTQGLFRISYDGKKGIEYTAPVSVQLKKYLKSKILNEHAFWMIIVQIIGMARKIEIAGLHPGNLWLDMDTVFINEMSMELYFLYQPIMNANISGSAFALVNDITYMEAKKNIGMQTGYIEAFQDFLCSGNSYRLDNIEAYIAQVYPEIFNAVGSPDRGKSGFLTTDRTVYKEHYEKKPSKRYDDDEQGTVCLIDDEDEGTVCLNDDYDDDCGTMVLGMDMDDDDCGATSVLVTKIEKEAVLIHLKTGDRRCIFPDGFIIGKSNSADYCVVGNTAVSRKHATILKRDDEFYLYDCKSTNGTFLNDVRLEEGEEALLQDGDKFVLADEEFEIEIR